MKRAFSLISFVIIVALSLCIFGCANASNSSSSESESTSESESVSNSDKTEEITYTDVNLGEQISTDNIDFVFNESYWETIGSNGIELYNDGSKSRQLCATNGYFAFVLKGTLKNKTEYAIDPGSVIRGNAYFNDDYKGYLSFCTLSDRSMIEPQETMDVILLTEVNPAVQDNYKSVDFNFGFSIGLSQAETLEDCGEVYRIHLE